MIFQVTYIPLLPHKDNVGEFYPADYTNKTLIEAETPEAARREAMQGTYIHEITDVRIRHSRDCVVRQAQRPEVPICTCSEVA